MLYADFTSKLLEMEDVIIDSVTHTAIIVEIHLHQQQKQRRYPACEKTDNSVRYYRTQRIKDLPILGKQTVLYLLKCRYRCKNCGKRFPEPTTFLPRYYRMTNRIYLFVITTLAGVCSFTCVAKEVGLFLFTVLRIFDIVQYSKPAALLRVLEINEF